MPCIKYYIWESRAKQNCLFFFLSNLFDSDHSRETFITHEVCVSVHLGILFQLSALLYFIFRHIDLGIIVWGQY